MRLRIGYLVLATRSGVQLAAPRARALLLRVPTATLLRQHCRMQNRECFNNVAATVERHGGEAVYGWQVSPLHFGSLVGFDLETHCAWRMPSGELVEVTEGKDSRGFFDGKERMGFIEDSFLVDLSFTIAAVETREQAATAQRVWRTNGSTTRVTPASDAGIVEVEPWKGWLYAHD